MEVLLGFVGVVLGILNLTLFFKIWGMTNDVRELKDVLLEEIQKNSNKPVSNANQIQNAKNELVETERQINQNDNPKDALIRQFNVSVKKYKLQCATNSISDDKYRAGVQSIIKAYQKRASEEQLNIDFNSLVD